MAKINKDLTKDMHHKPYLQKWCNLQCLHQARYNVQSATNTTTTTQAFIRVEGFVNIAKSTQKHQVTAHNYNWTSIVATPRTWHILGAVYHYQKNKRQNPAQ